MRIRLTNKAAFFKRLVSVVPEAERELEQANRKSAETIVAMAQRLVPVDSGTLRDSIRMEKGRNPTAYLVRAGGPTTTKPVRNGSDAEYDYALGVEFGTVDTPEQPFFYPSVRANRRSTRGRATRALRKAIKAKGF